LRADAARPTEKDDGVVPPDETDSHDAPETAVVKSSSWDAWLEVTPTDVALGTAEVPDASENDRVPAERMISAELGRTVTASETVPLAAGVAESVTTTPKL